MVQFPTLDKGFIDWFCESVDLLHALNPADVRLLFQESGYRPELLTAAADEIRLDLSVDPRTIPARFAMLVQTQVYELNAGLRRMFRNLTLIQSAVLRVMSAKGNHYAAFEGLTMLLYAKAMQQGCTAVSNVKVEVPVVKQALIALQEKNLVWRTTRGVYAIEEDKIVDLLREDGLLDDL